MTQKIVSGRWIVVALTLATLVTVTLSSFSGNGMQVEAGGIEMTLKASIDKGVTLVFAAV
ncbi:MAG: hypothetical protein GYB42_11380 [Alphaproteobacteria bacterium]|jgi:hypothetical protein|nr:hypothetical protein [Alphaproteobacteria bacterium]